MDRVRWALIGALWMAICVAAHEAYLRWVFDALPTDSDAQSDSFRELLWWPVFGILSYLMIAVIGIGVMVAGRWVMNRRGLTAAQPPAEEGQPTG